MTAGLLALLQLTDTAFPSGTFTYSYGLEQLARERRVVTPSEVEAYVTSVLGQCIATADAPSAYATAVAATSGELEDVVVIDRALFRTKAAPELRAACVSTGRRLVEETAAHLEVEMLTRYADEVRSGRSPGTQPVAFGVVAAALGVEPADVAPALMLGAATAILQASMRLLPVSHRDVQATLHRLRPQIALLAEEIVEDFERNSGLNRGATAALENPELNPRATPELMSFQPMQEIASMRHATASARLFAS